MIYKTYSLIYILHIFVKQNIQKQTKGLFINNLNHTSYTYFIKELYVRLGYSLNQYDTHT